MCNQEKIIFDAICFPIPGCPAIVLFLDNNFLCFESASLKYLHGLKTHRDDIEYYAVSDPPNMHVRATRYAI